MPSLHAADALIVGVVLFSVCRDTWAKPVWAIWPAWVWFAVMATGNHFWLDCIAGIGVALLAMAIVYHDRSACCLPLVGRNRPPGDPRRADAEDAGTVLR